MRKKQNRKYWTDIIFHTCDSIQAPAQSKAAAAVITHQQQATLSHFCCSLAPSEFVEMKWSQHRTRAQENRNSVFKQHTDREQVGDERKEERKPRFGPKVFSAISAPVRAHLSPPSFLPPPSNKKAIKRYNWAVRRAFPRCTAFHLEEKMGKKGWKCRGGGGGCLAGWCTCSSVCSSRVESSYSSGRNNPTVAASKRVRQDHPHPSRKVRRIAASAAAAAFGSALPRSGLGGFFWGSLNNSASVSARERSGVGPLRSWYWDLNKHTDS